ncbi:matrilin-2-like isoform X2 [Acipenser ruthenus]|uniref:matrilin-2-like isoform X2 n=1 Tax=Acipenser ruthenus TaxID=7906 RepID=UPI0027424EA7|nr:matrilin-2-like isoform X2 [Acipenser ruthenus]
MKAALISLVLLLLFQTILSQAREKQHQRRRDDAALQSNLLESPCKGKPLDFVFIIDSSRSVRPHDYEKVKTFIINILKFLDVGPDTTRVGLIQYGSVVQSEFSLKTYKRKADIEKAVQNMIHLATGTMTGLAIQYTMNIAFSESEGARPLDMNIPRIAMIVTDGRPQDTVEEVSGQARDSGIKIFAIGVGRVDMSTLRAIGSEPHEEHVFLVANFSQIETLTSVFQSKLCGGTNLCTDVDHGCAHICISTTGSYVCKCRKGYTLNPDGKTCSAEDFCALELHGCQHLCVNVPGSYVCRCYDGYQLNNDKRTCSRIDFCDLGNHGCQHDCVTTANSYVCSCRRGFVLNPDGKSCRKTDPCALGNHGCEHECVNTEDSFICRCHAGYTLNPDGKTCKKTDACALGNHGCEHECVNTEDSFICRCRAGYTLNRDGKTCKRMDYCALIDNGCEHLCLNTEDSYICQCFEGYTLNDDRKTCRSRDICSTVEHGCEQLCVNTDGSYICKCLERYTLSEDGKRCKRCADGVIDLVFVIDGSKSLGPDNFELVKQFVKGIIDSLDISPTTTRVGLLQYSTKVRSEFTLAQFSSVKDVNEAVSQIKYMGRGSMTGSALKHMLETSFTEAEGARPASVPKVTIVFTDGRSQDDVSEWSTKAQKNGITMYAVGVGKAIEDELRQIASKPQDKHLYYAEDFSKMGEIADKLKSRICEEKPSLEDQCKCENVIDFQNQANEQMRKLTQRLEVMSRKVEALENRLGYK